jgi:mannan endo-1,4-beta-mannosidase
MTSFLQLLSVVSLILGQVYALQEYNKSSSSLFGNGVNLQPSYYCSGDQDMGWKLMNQYPKIETVRIELEDPDVMGASMDDFVRWISEAQQEGKTVIATYHRCLLLGSNDPAVVLAAADWWKDNYQKLGGNFIINIINEWGDHTMNVSNYATTYNSAIEIIRQVYSGPLIMDIPGWGQEFETAASASPLLKDQNIIFSAHLYPQSFDSHTNAAPTTVNLDHLQKTGRPCMIGEFGEGQGEGDTNVGELISYAKSLGWSVLGWAWNGDGGIMNMASPSWTEPAGCAATVEYTPSSYFSTVYEKL